MVETFFRTDGASIEFTLAASLHSRAAQELSE
jgi:hypothetical protein